MVARRVSPALTVEDAHSYINTVKETFHDQPTKYVEFIKLLNGVRDLRVDKDSVVARVEELMKGHQDLLLGFNVFLSPEAKKAARTKKKLDAAKDFMNNLKTRFQRLDTHVVGEFRGIMKMYKEGKMSVKKVREEVIDVLFYHEDLIEDFLRFFEKKPVASASLLLQL
ncbi:Paired amphipathic helix [Arabidopsis suecica]|uniref:Paired amphipathic helix n=1 Tax=Arabidopsis suecica TaxID=45249 RepID=A0A8T2CJ09_ARASU|nr:Paired amphipathic helix [Arabidopsis suecica]